MKASRSRQPIQQELAIARLGPDGKRPCGGKRKGAGRKPGPGKPRVRHASRPEVKARFAVHVTKRLRPELRKLRNFELCKVLRRAFVHGCRGAAFRICQFSIQRNHIHLVCEADTKDALARGIQGWSVRIARGLNGYAGRSGRVFYDRYHMELVTSPRQCRAMLCYVLQNARRHGEALDPMWGGIDPFSSAWWFDGWRDEGWREHLVPPEVRTVAEPQSWLLRVGWRQHGLIGVTEVPAATMRDEQARARAAKRAHAWRSAA